MNCVKSNKIVTLIFTVVATLKCRVVSLCFPFLVNLTQSVYTQHSPKQNPPECYRRLRILSYIQTTVSIGGQLVSQTWCSLKVNPHRNVCEVCCVIFCSTCSVLVRLCLFTTFQMQLGCAACTPSINYCRQQDKQIHTHRCYILCE